MSGEQANERKREILELVEEYRDRCLWFLRPDYVPSTPEEIDLALEYIERYGDQRAYRHVEEIKKWLSRHTKPQS